MLFRSKNKYTTLSKQVINEITKKFEELEDRLYAANKAVDEKIENGTYTTSEQVQSASEWNE